MARGIDSGLAVRSVRSSQSSMYGAVASKQTLILNVLCRKWNELVCARTIYSLYSPERMNELGFSA